MNVILMHGKDTNPDDKWYPWFAEELNTHGIHVDVPVLPKSDDPVLADWLEILDGLEPDEDTVLVGHSRGGVVVLRYLERMPEGGRVRKVILVAANSGSAKFQMIKGETNHGFYTEEGYDFSKIRSHCDNFTLFHSRDDKWVPFAHGQENAKGLGAKFITFDNKGHFGKNDGIVPGLIVEVLN